VNRFIKFLTLPWQDRLLLIHAFFVLTTATLGLRVYPWSTLERRLLKLANVYARFATTLRPPAEKIAWAVKVASSFIPKATCLPRALAAQVLLLQNAYSAELRIGVVRTKEGKLEAHAWVISEKGILIGNVNDLDHFTLLSPTESQGNQEYGRAV
jgi:hypothetical protein